MDINKILEDHKNWLDGNGGIRANLCDASLRGANLCDASLRGASLCDADLRGANLCGADLCDADLRGASLRGANLCGASLCDADLRDADLRDADLCDADLRGANLCGANLCGANLCGADLCGASLWLCAGNNKEIKSIFVSEKYAITYTTQYLQIGCKRHAISDWQKFSDDEISKMDRGALKWWKENKDFIFMAIERYPATPTGKE